MYMEQQRMRQAQQMLSGICSQLRPQGSVIIYVPNVAVLPYFSSLCALQSDQNADE